MYGGMHACMIGVYGMHAGMHGMHGYVMRGMCGLHAWYTVYRLCALFGAFVQVWILTHVLN